MTKIIKHRIPALIELFKNCLVHTVRIGVDDGFITVHPSGEIYKTRSLIKRKPLSLKDK